MTVFTTTAQGAAVQGPDQRRGSDFAELSRLVKRAGLLRRRYGYYAARIALNVALLAAGVVAFVLLGSSWWQMLTAALFTQFAYVGHDAGHRQIFAARWRNDLVGYVHAAITGISTVFLVLSPVKAVLFIAVHQALMGVYLGCSFAPNHKGMPVLAPGEKLDFLRKQVLTSRNVTGGRWVDFLLGGLNYQIEHHLFPSMPRPNLRRAQDLVEDFCSRQRIAYSQAGLLHSYAEVVRHLHRVGAPLRSPTG
jgi:fatty acid desaturase